MTVIYVDTSVFLRACLSDATDHAAAHKSVTASEKPLVSSELLWLEADRAAIRLARENPECVGLPQQVTNALTNIGMIPLTRAIIDDARRIPQTVKALDAIHIASAETLDDALAFVATRDKAMVHVLNERGVETE